ncbi:hypothetical protein [Paenibacillus silviterrae]|uniref:hypothetical protein n=1 Tax=Paenibacillus silviterrae TaxID=3242194 RepID=UPI0025439DD9|nr:hypothetical protein [Paenibacillus chinjuensis]
MTTDGKDSLYLNFLERWVGSALPYRYSCPDRPELACYGTGENTWGVQTNQKAFAAFAVTAADPRYNEERSGIPRGQLKSDALRLLRYSLQTHIEGDYRCTDGTQWGHTWISVLGVERMMHGVEALEPELGEEDRDLLRRVLISESDWLLDHYTIVGGLYNKDGNNKPESNLWNGALLHRTAELFPDCKRATEYKEKALSFFINSISVPSDAHSLTLKDGKSVAERFIGANFFDSMALNHHGYLNVGYMVICLSNMAMLHFACKRRGSKAPEALYHHMNELWELVKLCTFRDGRLLRIGGDTRMRYTYCQEYAVPMWHMAKDLLNDPDCDRFEEGWLQIVRREMDANGDGSFLSGRGRALQQQSPLYYTRLESDRAVALSMGLAWRPLIGQGGTLPGSRKEEEKRQPIVIKEAAGCAWHDEYHGAYLHSSEKRIASWVWESAEKPQGLCLPPGRSDMAEWKENLSVRLTGLGRLTVQRLEQHTGQMFEGGFLTWGSMQIHTLGLLGEGQRDHPIARSRLVCAALPDNTHMLLLQHTEALEQRVYVSQVKGLHLLMPNDLYNGNVRSYHYREGGEKLAGEGSGEQLVRTGSPWLNIDDQLGVIAAYGAKELTIYRPGRRQIGLKEKLTNIGLEGMLYADEICAPCETGLQSVDARQVLVDAGFILKAGEDAEATGAYAEPQDSIAPLIHQSGLVRGIRVRGADGYDYVLAANLGNTNETARLTGNGGGVDISTGQALWEGSSGMLELELQAGAARLVRLV